MKRKLFAGVLLATIAVGAALQGNATSSKRLIPIGGPLNGTACSNEVDCTTTPGTPVCRFGENEVQQYTKSTPLGNCIIPLYEIQ